MIFDNILEISDKYDSFLLDIYGVLYDGDSCFSGVIETLEKLKNQNKELILVSNTTLVASVCEKKYSEKGLKKNIHYDKIISSGEFFKINIHKLLNGFSKKYFQIFHKNDALFEGSGFIEVNNLSDADFVYVGAVLDNYIDPKFSLKYFLNNYKNLKKSIPNILYDCLKFNKTLVVINPDIFAIEGKDKKLIFCQGYIGDLYESIGGKVLYFGKPYHHIFDFAISTLKGPRIAMIGDTPWTDIVGGNVSNVDTVLTLSGIAERLADDINNFEFDVNFSNIVNISAKLFIKNMEVKEIEKLTKPNYIIKNFAAPSSHRHTN